MPEDIRVGDKQFNVGGTLLDRPFQIRRLGHFGLDVHDVGDYKVGDQWRVLEPGMSLTVEPGPMPLEKLPSEIDQSVLSRSQMIVVWSALATPAAAMIALSVS